MLGYISYTRLSIPVFRGLTLLDYQISEDSNWSWSLSIPVFRGLTLLVNSSFMAYVSPYMPFNPRFQGTYFVRQSSRRSSKKPKNCLSIPVFRGLTLLARRPAHPWRSPWHLSIPVFRGLTLLGIYLRREAFHWGSAFNPRFQGTYFVSRGHCSRLDQGKEGLSIPVFRGLTLLGPMKNLKIRKI